MKNTKILTISIALITLFFIACKEQTPPGLDLGQGALVEDSTYFAGIENPQEKLTLVEEVTGVGCTNCPGGARLIKSISQQNNNRTIVVAIHATGFAQPYPQSQYDFRTEDGTAIVNSLGQPGLPAAAIDRLPNTQGVIFRPKADWSGLISDQITNKTTPVNIHLESQYIQDGNECIVTIKSAFTEDVNEDLTLTLYVLEDSIIDYQLDGEAAMEDVLDYKHDHVFRDCITNILGTPLNFGEKKAGNVLQKRISFNPKIDGDNSWNLDKCHIVAFVSRTGVSREIIHAEEIKLK